MKSRLWLFVRKLLPYLLSILAVALFVGYLVRNAERYRMLLRVSAISILSLLSLVICFALGNGLINFFFYRTFGISLTLNESFGLATVNTLANQLPFAGGLMAKAVYLKERHRLAYTHFLAATLALYICFVAANGTLGLVVLVGWWLTNTQIIPPVLALGFSSMTLTLASLWLPLNAVSLPGALGNNMDRLAEGWGVLRRHLWLAGVLIALQVVTTLIFAGRLWIAFRALSQQVSYAQCLLFASATVLTRLVNIAPGGLGVREGIVAGVAALLGFEPGVSAVAVGLDRLVATSVIIVLGTVYTYVLSAKAANDKPADPAAGGEEG